jgi:DNA-binding IclR family transcriptional regulator
VTEILLSKITERGEEAMHLLSKSEYGLSLSGFTEETDVGQSTWFKALNRLEEIGVVLRDRNKVYHLTDLGEGLLEIKNQHTTSQKVQNQ